MILRNITDLRTYNLVGSEFHPSLNQLGPTKCSREASIPGRLWIMKVKGKTNRCDFSELIYMSVNALVATF